MSSEKVDSYLKKLQNDSIDSEEIEEEDESVESVEASESIEDSDRASSWLAGQRSLKKKSFQETMQEKLEDIESVILDEIEYLRQRHAEDEQETREFNDEIQEAYLVQLQNFQTFIDVFEKALLEKTVENGKRRNDLIQNFHEWMQRVKERQDEILALGKARNEQVKNLSGQVQKFVAKLQKRDTNKSEVLKALKEFANLYKKWKKESKQFTRDNQKAVEMIDAKVSEFNEMVTEFKESVEKHNRDVEEFNREAKAYNTMIEAKSGTNIIQRGLR